MFASFNALGYDSSTVEYIVVQETLPASDSSVLEHIGLIDHSTEPESEHDPSKNLPVGAKWLNSAVKRKNG